jgi:hypothetical protein
MKTQGQAHSLSRVAADSESLVNLQQLDPFIVHVHGNGAAPRLHIPANGPDRVLIRAGNPQQVQERAVSRDPHVGTDHGPGILLETLHGPGVAVMHKVHPDAHRRRLAEMTIRRIFQSPLRSIPGETRTHRLRVRQVALLTDTATSLAVSHWHGPEGFDPTGFEVEEEIPYLSVGIRGIG